MAAPRRAARPRGKARIENTKTGPVAKEEPGFLSQVGSFVSKHALPLIAKVAGLGAYSVSKNSLTNGGPPMFAKPGELVYSYREFLGDVVGSVGFSSTSYSINPGLPGSFPLLAPMLQNMVQYEMCGLLYEFKSTSATAVNSTNTALGTVIMATNYNVVDSPFVDKRAMESAIFSTSCKPADCMIHAIECAPSKTIFEGKLFLRTGAVPATADPRTYDLGRFTIATQGMQAAATIGELWVTYHVKAFKPQIPGFPGQNNYCAAAVGTGSTSAAIFPTTLLAGTRSGSAFTLAGIAGNNVLTMGSDMPGGRYFVSANWVAATSVTTVGVWVGVANCGVRTDTWQNDVGGTYASNLSGSGTSQFTISCVADFTGPELGTRSIGINSGFVTVGACAVTVFVMQIPGDLTVRSVGGVVCPPGHVTEVVHGTARFVPRLQAPPQSTCVDGKTSNAWEAVQACLDDDGFDLCTDERPARTTLPTVEHMGGIQSLGEYKVNHDGTFNLGSVEEKALDDPRLDLQRVWRNVYRWMLLNQVGTSVSTAQALRPSSVGSTLTGVPTEQRAALASAVKTPAPPSVASWFGGR